MQLPRAIGSDVTAVSTGYGETTPLGRTLTTTAASRAGRFEVGAEGRTERKETYVKVRTTYFTIRCPVGCEAWLFPRASLRDHIDRCTRHPWVDEIEEVAVIPAEYTSLIAGAVDVALLGFVSEPGSSRAALGDGRSRSPVPTPPGHMTVATPVTGIRPRRWLTVAMAATERLGSAGLRRALDPASFHDLEVEVLTPGSHVECPICGALIATGWLKRHQATNGVCGWKRAATEVRTAWAAGWRDPFSLPGAPLTWAELRAKCWRERMQTILFPRWIAVLLSNDGRRPAPGRSSDHGGTLTS